MKYMNTAGEWHMNTAGEWHRVNGPAYEWNDGDYAWYYNGQRHRYYGVARCWDGEEDYVIFGERVI